MNILVVPDGFKDSLSAQEVCSAMCKGIANYDPTIVSHAIYASDGGDGFLNAIKHYKPNLDVVSTVTKDPLGRTILATYLWDAQQQSAYVELAAASGIELLLNSERRVMETSTKGTGMQLLDAIKRGAKQIYIGLGGSATNDAAVGIAAVLGYTFFEEDGSVLEPCGENLNRIHTIQKQKSTIDSVKIFAVNDVQNPLFGPTGAAYTYAKQKGASPEQIKTLDAGLRQLDTVVTKQLKRNVANSPGAGAAGGTAYGLKVFFNAEFLPGSEFILGLSNFYSILKQHKVDFILTGEGCIDQQTKHGKLIKRLILEGQKHKIPVLAICGKLNLSRPEFSALGLLDARELFNPNKPKEYSYTHASTLITSHTRALLQEHA